jgi:hypothetical protein
LFSKAEQNAAEELMNQQFTSALGSTSPNWSNSDKSIGFKNAVEFLEGVSDEEKQSLGWALNRASAQRSYEIVVSERGEVAEDLSSPDPLVQLIKAAMDAGGGDPTRDRS